MKKTLLQAAGAALIAELGNGEGLNAALGAAASQLAAGEINSFARDVAQAISDNPVKQGLIANLISNVISGGVGYVSGDETGSSLASIINRYNWQIHPHVLKKIEEIAADKTLEKRLIAAACALVNCYTEYDKDDPRRKMWEDIFRYGSSDELKEERKFLKDSGIVGYTSYQAALDGLKDLGLISGVFAGTRMLSTFGPQIDSKTVYQTEKGRIDVENPAPGERAGQINFHDVDGKKYTYDPSSKSFVDAPNRVNKLLKDPVFMDGIKKGMKYLGEIK